MLLHDPPERARVGRAHGLALVQHGRGADQQRRVDDVGVPDDPADVAGGEHRLARPYPEHRLHRPGERDRVPAVFPHDPLRPARGPRRVQHVQRVRRGDRHAGNPLGGGHQLVVVEVAARRQHRPQLRALQDDDVGRRVRGLGQRRVQHGLVGDHAARLDAARGGDDDDRLRVVDAGRELGRGEPAEHHRVDRAEPGAGEHGDHGQGDHRQVDHDPVTPADAEPTQHTGEARDLVEELGVGERGDRAGDRRVVDQGRLVAAAVADVPVQRVVTGVEHPAGEPPVQRRGVGVQDALGGDVPLQECGRVAPEPVRVGQAAGVGLGPGARGGAERRLVLEHGVIVARRPPPGQSRRRGDRPKAGHDGRAVGALCGGAERPRACPAAVAGPHVPTVAR